MLNCPKPSPAPPEMGHGDLGLFMIIGAATPNYQKLYDLRSIMSSFPEILPPSVRFWHHCERLSEFIDVSIHGVVSGDCGWTVHDSGCSILKQKPMSMRVIWGETGAPCGEIMTHPRICRAKRRARNSDMTRAPMAITTAITQRRMAANSPSGTWVRV